MRSRMRPPLSGESPRRPPEFSWGRRGASFRRKGRPDEPPPLQAGCQVYSPGGQAAVVAPSAGSPQGLAATPLWRELETSACISEVLRSPLRIEDDRGQMADDRGQMAGVELVEVLGPVPGPCPRQCLRDRCVRSGFAHRCGRPTRRVDLSPTGQAGSHGATMEKEPTSRHRGRLQIPRSVHRGVFMSDPNSTHPEVDSSPGRSRDKETEPEGDEETEPEGETRRQSQ